MLYETLSALFSIQYIISFTYVFTFVNWLLKTTNVTYKLYKYKRRVCYVIMYIVLKVVHTRYLQEELFRRMQPSTIT